MKQLSNMPAAGVIVCAVILILFVFSLIVLFSVCGKYRRLTKIVAEGSDRGNAFLRYAAAQYTEAYKLFGDGVNTPAIVDNAVDVKLSRLRTGERFINNAVSLFVTLGLFGTFLGLSLSVSSLTELISYSNTSEWLSVLDSVGGGLMSALSGMGVAFYTSLVGAGCSILLTLLRTMFSPASSRETLATALELWLDHSIAPTLTTDAVSSEATLANRMLSTLNDAAARMEAAIDRTSGELKSSMESGKGMVIGFNKTVKEFNEGVHQFSEVDYNLRGTVERMDLCARDLSAALRQGTRELSARGDAGKGAEA